MTTFLSQALAIMTTFLSQALATMLLFLAFLFGVALFLGACFSLYMAIQQTGKLTPEEARYVARLHECECEACQVDRAKKQENARFWGLQ